MSDTRESDINGLEQASGTSDNSTAADIVVDGVPVDESLFEDLDDLDLDG